MRLIRLSLLWIALGVCLSSSLLSQQASKKFNPADVYLRGYLIMEDGMKLLENGDFSGSYYKLKDANDIFSSVFHSDPNWNPEIVEYRRKRVTELMESARQQEIARRQKVAQGATTVRPTAPNEVPMPALPAVPKTTSGTEPVRSTDAVLQAKVAELQERIRTLDQKNDQSLKEIGAKDQALSKMGAQLLEAEDERRRLLTRLTDANMKLEAAPSARDKVAMQKEINDLKKDRERLNQELTGVMQKLQEVEGKNRQLLTDVREAYATIKQMNDEKTALLAERDQMRELLESDAGKSDKTKLLAAENLKLKKSLEEVQARLAALQTERTNEQKQVQTDKMAMQKQREEDQKLIADLKIQLDTTRGELAKIKQENEDYQNQMAALSARLDATERALAQSAGQGITEAEAVKENHLLHEIIVKMIKQQSGRERAKKLALAELETTGQMSEQLISSIREMSEPYQMTPAERALLQAAGGPRMAEDGSGINATLISPQVISDDGRPRDPDDPRATPPTADVSPEELKAYSTAAQRFFGSQQFEEAESSYEKILRVDPLNFGARCNMAVSQVRQGKLDAAMLNLNKVLAYHYDHDFPHYLRGTVLLRQNNLKDATEAISTALKINENNGDGHFALGLIYTKQKRFRDAETSFKKAVEFNPANGEAHYNLAILYATSENPQMAQAKIHYRQAIKLGVSPDQNLNKLLNL
jgi:tetratricopeptide (TPR) repeat protein